MFNCSSLKNKFKYLWHGSLSWESIPYLPQMFYWLIISADTWLSMSTPVANSAHISNSACTYSQPLDLAEDRDIQRSHASAPGSLRQTGNKFVNCQVFIQWQSPQQPGSLKHFWISTFAKLLPGFSLFWKCKTEIKGFQTLGYGGQLLRHTSWSRFLRTFSECLIWNWGVGSIRQNRIFRTSRFLWQGQAAWWRSPSL